MLVTILIDVYYSSIDEAQSKMAAAAAALLMNKDIPGFFDACGMYYVRSINRQAALLSTFSYESKSSSRDFAFEASLRVAVASFGVAGGGGSVASDTAVKQASKFSSSNLSIRTIGMGLGKSESVMLVSYDLDTFRNAVKGAFQASQPEDVGMVTSIEVAPWVENPDFQNLNKLEPLLVPVLTATGQQEFEPQIDPAVPPKKKMKMVMPYAQKRTLTQNSEFLAEADRAARAKLNIYYKAKACKSRIELDKMIQQRPGKWMFQDLPLKPAENPEGKTTEDETIFNNRTGANPLRLGDFYYKTLAPSAIQLIWMEYDSFVYGGSGPASEAANKSAVERSKVAMEYLVGEKSGLPYPHNVFPGSTKCLEDLTTAGITAVSYRTIPTCERLEELFLTVNGRMIDDYCMPSYGGVRKAGFDAAQSALPIKAQDTTAAPLSPEEKERAARQKERDDRERAKAAQANPLSQPPAGQPAAGQAQTAQGQTTPSSTQTPPKP
jgi:hypothetical protein